MRFKFYALRFHESMINKVVKIIKVIFWLIPVIFLFWLFNKNFVPGGILTAKCDADKCSKLAAAFATKEPEKIIGETKDGDRYRLIAHDPIYFTVKTPRPFAKAKISVEFANPNNQPVFNFGALASNGAYVFKNVFSHNSLIEQLEKDWDAIKENDSYLFTRPEEEKEDPASAEATAGKDDVKKIEKKPIKKYSSIDEFANNLPPLNEVRTHNYDLSDHIRLKDYKPSDKRLEIRNTLRGPHEIVTYIENEPLDFKFSFQDINRHKGADDFKIIVSRNGKKVLEKKVSDDGISKASGAVKEPRNIDIYLEKPAFGVYSISIQAKDDDIFIKNISTRQSLAMFNNHLYFADDDEYKVMEGVASKASGVLLSGQTLSARTSHKGALQAITVDKKPLILKEVNKEYEFKRNKTQIGILQVAIPKSDVYLSTDGFFVFDSRQFFNPDLGAVLNLVADVPDNINYVITQYPKLTDLGDGWLKAEAEFSGKELYRDDKGQYSFILQIPGLPENKRTLKLRKIEVEFAKEPITIFNLWTKVKTKYKL